MDRVGDDVAFYTFNELFLGWLGRFILFATKGEKGVNIRENQLNERLSSISNLASWLEVWDKITYLLSRTDAINLDRRQMIISVFLVLEKTLQF